MKNKKFLEDCKKFMSDILQKGYARMTSGLQPFGKTWYIWYHDIYHPRTPRKM